MPFVVKITFAPVARILRTRSSTISLSYSYGSMTQVAARAIAGRAADSAAGQAMWAAYQRRWTGWNHVRTLACIVAMALFIVAIRQGAGAV